jgi:uncharacterized protein (TIGR03435 family)
MKRLILALFMPLVAVSQALPEFEVASIRPTGNQPPNAVNAGVHIDGALARFNYLALKDYVGMAFRIKLYQISGPDWLATERFDIAAKLPDGGATAKIPEMMQSLLADRFQMKVHHEMKEFPVYALEVAKGGLRLPESPVLAEDADPKAGGAGVNVAATGSAGGVSINFGRGSYITFGNNKFEGKRLRMQSIIDTLVRFVDRPVIDGTDLHGTYDLVLELTPEDYQAMLIRSAIYAGVVLPPQALRALDNSSGDSLANALQKVGLKLEPRKAPLDFLVVDSMQRKPTEN